MNETEKIIPNFHCWKCNKIVLPEEVKKPIPREQCCNHCGADLILGVSGWVRPYFTLSKSYEPRKVKKDS